MKLLICIFALFLCDVITARGENDVLNVCLNSSNIITPPGPLSNFYQLCSPWKDRACCTSEKSSRSQDGSDIHFSFNYDHCQQTKEISKQCVDKFVQNSCFYGCSPNLGPWIKHRSIYIANKKFENVPLCESQCTEWFEACKNDYTCKVDWTSGWDWSSGINKCPPGSSCRTFQQTFNNASHFCQSVYPNDYKVVPDSSSCMVLWFDGKNPNTQVAQDYAKKHGLCCGSVNHQVSIVFVAVMMMTSYLWNY